MPDTPEVRALRKAAAAHRERGRLVDDARRAGLGWEEIAEAIELSRAGVIKLHNAWKAQQKS